MLQLNTQTSWSSCSMDCLTYDSEMAMLIYCSFHSDKQLTICVICSLLKEFLAESCQIKYLLITMKLLYQMNRSEYNLERILKLNLKVCKGLKMLSILNGRTRSPVQGFVCYMSMPMTKSMYSTQKSCCLQPNVPKIGSQFSGIPK